MPRRTAEERHRIDDRATTGMMDVLIAVHHPTRRWLVELLWVDGPATVGRLAARTGLAVGSVSHHLKPLHRQGFIEPTPELARDTRESWWRATHRNISWSADDFEPDSLGRRVADRAEIENFRHQVRATQLWLDEMADAPVEWRRGQRRPTLWSGPRSSSSPTCTTGSVRCSRSGAWSACRTSSSDGTPYDGTCAR
jgi:DNA-binding transcriptional ArsR family regulator